MKYVTRRYLLSKSYARYLRNWNFEWFATFTFSAERRFGDWLVKRYLLDWSRKLCTGENIQIAYFYVMCLNYGHPHVHLLMIGRGKYNRGIKTLRHVVRSKWEGEWPFLAKIETPESQAGVVNYFASHLFRKKCFRYQIDSYNLKLLSKLKTVSR
jgi:hypothetical protein